jgi:serine protease Do
VLANGKEVNAKTLGLYRKLDAGLMKITDEGEWPHAEIADSRKLGYGQWCVAMGHPGGYQEDRGVVLRLGQILHLGEDAITTNCTLVGGDSGGPLFDMEGRVIGINSRIAEYLTANMHVPVNAFREGDAWNRLVSGEAWGHLPGQNPWLGVSGDSAGASSSTKGAKITKVTEKSPAARAGLLVGDVVIGFSTRGQGSRDISDFPALAQAVDDCRPREKVTLTLLRGDEEQLVEVTLGRKPE